MGNCSGSVLRPSLRRESCVLVTPDELRRLGIKGLIVDIDNTLVEWNVRELARETEEWLSSLRESGIKCCLVSNSLHDARTAEFARAAGLPLIARAGKPRRRSFIKALEILGTAPCETAVIGDQIFTDILGGNRLGLFTILIEPRSPREFFGTRIVRILERLVLWWLGRSNDSTENSTENM